MKVSKNAGMSLSGGWKETEPGLSTPDLDGKCALQVSHSFALPEGMVKG